MQRCGDRQTDTNEAAQEMWDLFLFSANIFCEVLGLELHLTANWLTARGTLLGWNGHHMAVPQEWPVLFKQCELAQKVKIQMMKAVVASGVAMT